jgi:hypothetical protein
MDFADHFQQVIGEFETEGLLKLTNTHCALTVKGMALLDSITAAFTGREF